MLCYFLALTIVIKLPRAKIFIKLQEINFTKRQTGVQKHQRVLPLLYATILVNGKANSTIS